MVLISRLRRSLKTPEITAQKNPIKAVCLKCYKLIPGNGFPKKNEKNMLTQVKIEFGK